MDKSWNLIITYTLPLKSANYLTLPEWNLVLILEKNRKEPSCPLLGKFGWELECGCRHLGWDRQSDGLTHNFDSWGTDVRTVKAWFTLAAALRICDGVVVRASGKWRHPESLPWLKDWISRVYSPQMHFLLSRFSWFLHVLESWLMCLQLLLSATQYPLNKLLLSQKYPFFFCCLQPQTITIQKLVPGSGVQATVPKKTGGICDRLPSWSWRQ